MKLSETSAGRQWLENFIEPDVPAATILLDSVRFVTLTTLYSRLSVQIAALIDAGKILAPVLAIPERSLNDYNIEPGLKDPIAYEDFEPGSPPAAVPGSDAFVAGVLTQFTRLSDRPSSQWFRPDAGIKDLRRRRCRSIVIATDHAGTGDQVLKLVAALLRNRTLRSWRSLKLVQIHVVAFAVTPLASQRLKASKFVDGVWASESARDFSSAAWSTDTRSEIEELCVRECRSRRRPALGYKNSGGLFVTQRRSPNNVPAVFLQAPARWKPLFPNREVPPELAEEMGDHNAAPPLPELALRLGQIRVGQNERVRYLRPASERLLSALLLMHLKPRSTEQLAAELALPVEHAEALRETMLVLGFIDDRGNATVKAQQEIDAQKRRRRRTTAHLHGDAEPYYPLALR